MKNLALALVLFSGISASSSAATLFSDNFDADTLAQTSTTLINWNVTRANIDVIGAGSLAALGTNFDFYPGNGRYIDLAGTVGFGQITSKTTFNLTPGNYNLRFLLGKNTGTLLGSHPRTMTVSVGSFSQIISDNLTYANLVPVNFNFSVTTATTGNIVFDYPDADGNDHGFGYIIDAVTLTSSAPEPGTLALLGLGGLVLVRRRSSASVR